MLSIVQQPVVQVPTALSGNFEPTRVVCKVVMFGLDKKRMALSPIAPTIHPFDGKVSLSRIEKIQSAQMIRGTPTNNPDNVLDSAILEKELLLLRTV